MLEAQFRRVTIIFLTGENEKLVGIRCVCEESVYEILCVYGKRPIREEGVGI